MKVAQEQGVDLSTVLSEDEAERTKELEADFDKEATLKSVGQDEEKKPEEKAAVEEEKPPKETPEPKAEAVVETPKPATEKEPQVDFGAQLKEKDELLIARDTKIQELEAQIKSGEIRKQRQAKIIEADHNYGKFVEQRSLATMKAIDAVSEEDPDYDKKIASIRAREASDIKIYERQHPELVGIFYNEPPKPVSRELVSKPTEVVAQPAKKEGDGVPSEEIKQLQDFVTTAAGKAGLDPKDATFTYFCNQAPTKVGETPMPFEDQVAWAIERTKTYQLFVQTEASEKGVSRQKKDLPLGRGTGDLPKGKEKEYRPVSIDDALIAVRQERTL